jgi:sterol desaturase/sphingolipid hydroxylase (fatty acid hydroxylase superfamily)
LNRPDAPKTNHVDEFGIDYTRPVFAQLDALGDRYWDWVHIHLTPSFSRQLAAARPDNRWPGSFPIFANPWLESQTHIRWQTVLGLWGAVVAACLAAALGLGLPVHRAGVAFLCGFLVWTLVEYGLHRVLFHKRPQNGFERKLHFLAHGIHHKDPWDGTRLVFPILAGVAIALVLFGLLRLALPLPLALAVMSGLLLGYLAYDMGHYAWHHMTFKAGWLKYLKRYHLAHHYQDMDSRFGVSVPLWDWIFGTGRVRT